MGKKRIKQNNAKDKKKEKEECPLCEVSEETLKILKEKGKKVDYKEKPKNNGRSRIN